MTINLYQRMKTVSSSSSFGVQFWKHNNNIVKKFSGEQLPGLYQLKKNNALQLHINKIANSDSGLYSCEVSIRNVTLLSKSFTLNISSLFCVV